MIKLHRTLVVSGEVTNREKILYDDGGNKAVEVRRTRKNCVTYYGDSQSLPITDNYGRRESGVVGWGKETILESGVVWCMVPETVVRVGAVTWGTKREPGEAPSQS
jgi:hypothetical protein